MAKRRIPKEVKQEVSGFINILRKEKLPIKKVVLFGSYAKGKPRKWSDIDLCIISPKFKNPFRAMQYLWQKRPKDTGLTIEPVGFTPEDFKEDSSLISEIKKTGIEMPITA